MPLWCVTVACYPGALPCLEGPLRGACGVLPWRVTVVRYRNPNPKPYNPNPNPDPLIITLGFFHYTTPTSRTSPVAQRTHGNPVTLSLALTLTPILTTGLAQCTHLTMLDVRKCPRLRMPKPAFNVGPNPNPNPKPHRKPQILTLT